MWAHWVRFHHHVQFGLAGIAPERASKGSEISNFRIFACFSPKLVYACLRPTDWALHSEKSMAGWGLFGLQPPNTLMLRAHPLCNQMWSTGVLPGTTRDRGIYLAFGVHTRPMRGANTQNYEKKSSVFNDFAFLNRNRKFEPFLSLFDPLPPPDLISTQLPNCLCQKWPFVTPEC